MEEKSQNVKGFDKEEKIQHVKDIPELYKSWFLDYASYVILERAIPEVLDGLKPVQRRILHTMKRLEDGRYNKVANIIGFTMQYHPHGDASIGDALVSLAQKELLIDTQGNWGNTLTGDRSAAPRYIEARLSKFALDVVFNPKTTEWINSYDGRNKEPVVLPVKFPILLFLGAEGIAVGLASKILPHNFNELIDASIAYLNGEKFSLYPDFPSGGSADFSKYNDGLQGGKVKVRAKIEKIDKKSIKITEIPFGKNSTTLIESILLANEKGKIKIKKIDDNTSDKVEIMIYLPAGTSPDKTIDALYAFTDCEVSISPNCCVIMDKRPKFIGVSEMLRISTNSTVGLLNLELEIRKREIEEAWHLSSLEKIFIENRIYIDIENCETWESIIETIDKGLTPFKKLLNKDVTTEDIAKLTEIKIKRISKYDSFKADEHIRSLEEELESVKEHLKDIKSYTINFFLKIREKFGVGKERQTEIRSFDQIEATKVVAANKKLYVNRDEGFFGFALKNGEFVRECSDIDDIILFMKDGTFTVKRVDEKSFAGKDIIHIDIYNRGDERTIYNVIYRDGKDGKYYMKRFPVKSVTRDKLYDLTKGQPDSKVIYFTANPNGEAEKVKIFLRPKKRLRNLQIDLDFSELTIKGRNSQGNILTKNPVSKVQLRENGVSTLGGIELWFDSSIHRLNRDGRGEYLGEFSGEDRIIEVTGSGMVRLYNFDISNHFSDDHIIIKKYDKKIVYTAVYFDADQGFYYLKRFNVGDSHKKIRFIGEDPDSKLLAVSENPRPIFHVEFGGKSKKKDDTIDGEKFISVKGITARGKRISTQPLISVKEETDAGEKKENIITEDSDSKDFSQKDLF